MRTDVWKILCRDFFQSYIPVDSSLLELGAGHCEFINSITAGKKTAIDLNEETAARANDDIEVLIGPLVTRMADLKSTYDIIFISNVLEHLCREDIVEVLARSRQCLCPGGRIIILQPNYRYIYRDFWMFFDHITPIDDRSLRELLELSGFTISRIVPRFLPYTTKSRLPKARFLVRLYIRIPLLWHFFGGQALAVAEKK
jgi:SAM-dependent methyltransferase